MARPSCRGNDGIVLLQRMMWRKTWLVRGEIHPIMAYFGFTCEWFLSLYGSWLCVGLLTLLWPKWNHCSMSKKVAQKNEQGTRIIIPIGGIATSRLRRFLNTVLKSEAVCHSQMEMKIIMKHSKISATESKITAFVANRKKQCTSLYNFDVHCEIWKYSIG